MSIINSHFQFIYYVWFQKLPPEQGSNIGSFTKKGSKRGPFNENDGPRWVELSDDLQISFSGLIEEETPPNLKFGRGQT
jgi:hypothetical protein